MLSMEWAWGAVEELHVLVKSIGCKLAEHSN